MSSPLFFSRITLRESAPISTLRTLMHDGYAPHKTVWQLLSHSPEQKRNFLFRYDIEPQSGLPRFYVVSEQKAHDTSGLWNIESKPYLQPTEPNKPLFALGDTFSFSLRVNPTKTVETNELREYKNQGGRPTNERKDKDHKTRRVDVIWDARCKAKERDPRPPEERSWTNDEVLLEAATHWLSERTPRLGFELCPNTLLIEQYQRDLHPKHQRQAVRSREDFSKAKKFSTLDITGLLRVTDTDTFHTVLAKGIGHGKAFGCGLLLIRRL
ncbi:MAG: type I-E CRISPR-associated protein Cas6/Cse3/CasE [Candidatus Kapabacteria bacterium]|nr:type I-E CRISPR-associated protein Cas6/Cse3/CasE [Candidatus Kapabacteria bacterium]